MEELQRLEEWLNQMIEMEKELQKKYLKEQGHTSLHMLPEQRANAYRSVKDRISYLKTFKQ